MSKKVQTAEASDADAPALVPKLRFPKFRNAGEWKLTLLSEVLTEHKLKSDGNSQVFSVSVHKGLVNQIEHLGRSFSAADTSKYNLVRPHDIVYTKSPTGDFPYGIIKQSRITHNVIVSPLYGVFKPQNKYLGYMLDAYFESPARTKDYLYSIVKKGAKNTLQITNSTFLSKGICLPGDEGEHKKIADCLSSLDELIAAETSKVKALRAHKKGLMQQLFPAEGETIPKLRFPEFRNAPAWEKEVLEPYIEEYRESSTRQDQYEVLTSARTGLIKQSEYYENSRLTKRDNIGFNILPPDFITYRSRSDDSLFFFNENNLGFTGIVSVYYPVFRIVNGCNKFFINLLSWHAEEVGKHSAGNAQKVLSINALKNIALAVPSSDEQSRIANALASLDNLIDEQAQIVEALKTHKKGLMQQFFPAIDEGE